MIHQEKFTVRSYEMDVQGMASVPAICNYLQEVAGNHATELGVAVDHLFKKNRNMTNNKAILRLPEVLKSVDLGVLE